MEALLLQVPSEKLIFGLIGSGKFIELVVEGVLTIVGILGTAYLAYKYALRRLKRETPLLLQRELYSKKLNALQDFWKLLQHTTDNENEKSILVYEQIEEKPRKWFLVMENAKAFRNQLVSYFYGSGSGIFITKELKELLFEYDRQLYGFLLSEKNNTETRVQIKNNYLAERMVKIHEELAELLKKSIKELPVQIENEK